MWRILRAFAWLRWRMLINSMEKTGARDTLERFSVAIEKILPIMVAILMVPSALALSALGAAAGFALARDESRAILFSLVRFILIAVPILSIVGPLLLPAADRANPVRLLLLPISRRTLYVAQSASAFGDLWVVMMLPLVGFVPLGLAAGGAPAAALFALVCGAVLVAVIVGISSLATSLLHLAVRDRRRGELLALIFILVIPMISMLPTMLPGARRERPHADGQPSARGAAGRAAVAHGGGPARVRVVSDGVLHHRHAGRRRVAICCLPPDRWPRWPPRERCCTASACSRSRACSIRPAPQERGGPSPCAPHGRGRSPDCPVARPPWRWPISVSRSARRAAVRSCCRRS